MKILRVISSMHPKSGGPCQGIRNAIPALRSLGVECEVVCLDSPSADFLGKDSFTIYPLGTANKGWGYQKNLYPWLLEHLGNYDVVVIHGLWLYHSHATIKAIKKFRKNNDIAPKVFVMPHGMLDPYFQFAKERRVKALRNTIYWRLIENRVINEADGVLFTCEEELLLARTTFPNYHPTREINVGYGIQTPPIFESAMQEAFRLQVPAWNQEPFLLFLSRIHHKKGVDLLIDAYLTLEKEIDHLPQLIIAGPGLDEDYGKEMLVKAGGSKNIIFPGMLSGKTKWGAFYLSEAFVLPSHQENFGIAVAEALACEKAVLISTKVNIWREIEKGKGGLTAEDNALGTLSLLKSWLKLSSKEKAEMSKAAKKVFAEHFTITEAAEQFLSGIKNA